MKTIKIHKETAIELVKSNLLTSGIYSLFLVIIFTSFSTASAQEVLFDFDNAPIHTSVATTLTVGGITAHFSSTGQGFSFQPADTMGFTPLGFTGTCIYPNSIYQSDLLISFDQTLTDFSIMYSPQELGCDDSATMKVTASMNGNVVGTNTKTASNPGTWPVDTLTFSFVQGFNSVVVHYNSHPPTCQDYGVIFLADNMRVTALNLATPLYQKTIAQASISPNPMVQSTTLFLSLSEPQYISVNLYDITGKIIKHVFEGALNTGEHQLPCTIKEETLESGLYFITISGEHFSQSLKLVVK